MLFLKPTKKRARPASDMFNDDEDYFESPPDKRS